LCTWVWWLSSTWQYAFHCCIYSWWQVSVYNFVPS
jgi:hypothetical protein